VVVSRRDGPSP